MKEERNIITMNEFGNVVMPKDIQATAMSGPKGKILKKPIPTPKSYRKDTACVKWTSRRLSKTIKLSV